ncbi:MAG: molybdopterin-binding protein [Clostridiales bacterium GWB2_37_7]|nr:MAG: molybdopterin-binding protein [Clostridiales bacterium GWB2_37_7]
MNTVRVEEAIGMVLAHDLTKIVPGEFKGAAYKKGHVIRQEDIQELKSMGKNHINILELPIGMIHENEAAMKIANAAVGSGIFLKGPSEGKVELKAKHRGLLKVDVAALNQINEIEELVIATIHTNTLVEEGQSLAAARIIPLVIKEEKILQVEEIGKSYGKGIITVHELRPMKIGLIITGTEVYEGRIKDGFAPVMKEKIKHYGCSLLDIQYCPDDRKIIEDNIYTMIEMGADIVLACGGMSVDADDVTPQAIRNASEHVVSYGIPILPGNMLMLAYKGSAAIIGIPGAVMFLKNTSLDILLPRILAGEKLTRKDVTAYCHGGLCWSCKACTYPMCPYGK